ncbi:hematopoietic prostaglandin D synthase-like [Amphiura filiformis]|uniref:hematopoietic prostaglandin D synthase-like n=1 Tax=Amphiura filiformis TaxID=82378 RepID=UPI003B2111F1
MTTKFKLTYFNGRGCAEVVRYTFAQAGVKYEDYRIDEHDDWPSFKPSTPTGQLPILEINGEVIPQSLAMVRYLAREFNLYGKDNQESLRCDVVIDVLQDIEICLTPMWHEEDVQQKKLQMQKLVNTSEAVLKRLDNLLKNDAKTFVGSSITIADIVFYRTIEKATALLTNPLDSHPRLKTLWTCVGNSERIADWISRRPETPW